MAYTLSNKCAKNLCKWTVLNLSLKRGYMFFLGHSAVVAEQHTVCHCFTFSVP